MQVSRKKYSRNHHKALLDQDRNVERWFTNNSKTSDILADVYLRALERFCEQVSLTPASFARLPVRRMEEVTEDFINVLESIKLEDGKQRYSPGYVESYLKAIKSFASWNNEYFRRKIKVADAGKTPTLQNERVPQNEELHRVLYADTTPLRERVSISLIAFSALRPEVLGDYKGLEGLRLKDFPELIVDNEAKTVEFSLIPTLVTVREELSKAGHHYFTFYPEQGCAFLKTTSNAGCARRARPSAPTRQSSPRRSRTIRGTRTSRK